MPRQVKLRLAHLYPEVMNLYGDRGNVIALSRRCLWRGIELEVFPLGVGDPTDFSRFDLVFIGGGQDREQMMVCHDLASTKGPRLKEAVEDGLPGLAICGGYQLAGTFYRTGDGEEMPGAGILDIWTVAGNKRMIGNVVVESRLGGSPATLVGFENHSGRTYLGKGVMPLGSVLVGFGNNGEDRTEGAVYKNFIGTYLHGSLLPKNPWLCDWLIKAALERRYGEAGFPKGALSPLDDALELAAHAAAARRAGYSLGLARS